MTSKVHPSSLFFIFTVLASSLPVDAYERALSRFKDSLSNLPTLLRAGGASLPRFGNDDPAATMPEEELDCNATRFNELWEDQALIASYSTYMKYYGTAQQGNCTAQSGSIFCPVNLAIPGETEYETACIAAGGVLNPISVDLHCDTTYDGASWRVWVDQAPWSVCFPSSTDFDGCVEPLRSILLQNYSNATQGPNEDSLTNAGFTVFDCRLGDESSSSTAKRESLGVASVVAMVVTSWVVIGGVHY